MKPQKYSLILLITKKGSRPRSPFGIRLSFFPLALAAFLGFIHNFQKVPFHPWENIFVSVLIVSIQILIIGSMIQQNFFTRIKNQTDIMKEWFSLDREFLLKIGAHSLDGAKHYLEYLHFDMAVREKKTDLNLVGSAAFTGLFLAFTKLPDKTLGHFFSILASLAVVATMTFIRDRKLLVELRRFEDILQKALASGGGPEEGAGIAAAKGRSVSEAGTFA